MPTQAPSPPSRPSQRRAISYKALPLWLQWVLPFSVAIAVVAAVVVYTHYETSDVNQQVDNYNSKSAEVQENQEDTIIVRQQQAPHVFKLEAGLSAKANARRAVVRYMAYEISHGVMDGPVKSSACTSAGGTPSRLVLHCDVVASVVKYPFDVVERPPSGTLTYCQRVAPPVPTMNIPVSARCT
jgi:hypothetical protein